MRKVLIIIVIGGFLPLLKAQKILHDKSIVNQYKRMVVTSWGNFYPYATWKRIIPIIGPKVQTNVTASMVWNESLYAIHPFANSTTRRNRRYRDGPDIRPLKPTGEETQRYAFLKAQQKETEKIKEEVEQIKEVAHKDFIHWTPTLVSADPLWILYYKRKLKPLKEFPEKPSNYNDWGFENPKVYQQLKSFGGINKLQERLDLLKDKYKIAREVAMPRGKRILMYHELLLEWRGFYERLSSYNHSTKISIEYKSLLENMKYKKEKISHRKSDTEIIQDVMHRYNNKF